MFFFYQNRGHFWGSRCLSYIPVPFVVSVWTTHPTGSFDQIATPGRLLEHLERRAGQPDRAGWTERDDRWTDRCFFFRRFSDRSVKYMTRAKTPDRDPKSIGYWLVTNGLRSASKKSDTKTSKSYPVVVEFIKDIPLDLPFCSNGGASTARPVLVTAPGSSGHTDGSLSVPPEGPGESNI